MNALTSTAAWFPVLWQVTGPLAVALFFGAVALGAQAVQLRRGRAFVYAALMAALSYAVLQCASLCVSQNPVSPAERAVLAFFTPRRSALALALCPCMAACEALLLAANRHHAARRITPSSIREATDTLPSGICFSREDGRVILANRAMEDLCRQLTGRALVNASAFYEALCAGTVSTECHRDPYGEPLIVLPDGAAWRFTRSPLTDGALRADMILASDVTEIYGKTLSLRRAQEEVTALNRRLTDYNREIVSLTAAREILNAKVKIHDELGGNLLAIHRWLAEGCAEADRAKIVERLRTNVDFLRSGHTRAAHDEYALMLETAHALGVEVRVEGAPPDRDPARHILAVAIHECFTNTLRHAHGSALTVRIAEEGGCIQAGFTNDGRQPDGPIRERGGLHSLRTLVERAGGSMTVQTSPAFLIALTLPKEDPHGLPSDDRG